MATYTVRLGSRAGGLLDNATVSADTDITLAELLRRAGLDDTPASGGDIISIEEDTE